MATERIEAELVAFSSWEAAGMARMLAMLGEFDRREGWRSWGCASAVQWLSWKCALGTTAASERLRVARVLPGLPLIADAFSRGKISWSKVREVTRVATTDTDRDLRDLALTATAAQLEQIVRAMRRVTEANTEQQHALRRCSWSIEPDGSYTFLIRLPALDGAGAAEAIKSSTVPVRGEPIAASRADAVVKLLTGESVTTQVVLHHLGDHAFIEDGPALSPSDTASACCNADVSELVTTTGTMVEQPLARRPNAAQRRWLARRHPICQVDGCHHNGRFDAHHLVEYGKGGKTVVANMARVCTAHHRAIHRLGLQARLDTDRQLTLFFPDGNPVDRPIEQLRYVSPSPDSESAIACAWVGERLDIHEIIWLFCQRQSTRTNQGSADYTT